MDATTLSTLNVSEGPSLPATESTHPAVDPEDRPGAVRAHAGSTSQKGGHLDPTRVVLSLPLRRPLGSRPGRVSVTRHFPPSALTLRSVGVVHTKTYEDEPEDVPQLGGRRQRSNAAPGVGAKGFAEVVLAPEGVGTKAVTGRSGQEDVDPGVPEAGGPVGGQDAVAPVTVVRPRRAGSEGRRA